jgi:hypothetical protein
VLNFTADLPLLVCALLLSFVVLVDLFGRPHHAARARAVLQLLRDMVTAFFDRGDPS